MNTHPLKLSICIPTYNRLPLLQRLLASLLPQIQHHAVEVCISDNCSTDGTDTYLQDLVATSPLRLRYIRQASNVGLDRNYSAVILMAEGQFVWPLGDDEVLLDNGLELILAELHAERDMLVLDGWHTTDTLDTLQRKYPILPSTLRGQTLHNAQQVFEQFSVHLTLSAYIVQRSLYTPSSLMRFIGTSHAVIGAVWWSLAELEESNKTICVYCFDHFVIMIPNLNLATRSWVKDGLHIRFYEAPLCFILLEAKATYQHRYVVDYLRASASYSRLGYLRAYDVLNFEKLNKLPKTFLTPYQIYKMKLVCCIPIPMALGIIQSIRVFKSCLRRGMAVCRGLSVR